MSTKKERQYEIYQAIDQYKLNRVFYLLKKQGVDKSVLINIEEQTKALRNTLCAISNSLVEEVESPKITDKNQMINCDHGLYRVHWKSGSSSLASIGSMHNGDRWISPTNWTGNSSLAGLVKDCVEDILTLELIRLSRVNGG